MDEEEPVTGEVSHNRSRKTSHKHTSTAFLRAFSYSSLICEGVRYSPLGKSCSWSYGERDQTLEPDRFLSYLPTHPLLHFTRPVSCHCNTWTTLNLCDIRPDCCITQLQQAARSHSSPDGRINAKPRILDFRGFGTRASLLFSY